jgi:holliday junction DNA helicase RuvA
MIAYLNGKILKKTNKGIILDTGNIGYFVHLSAPLVEKITEKDPLELFIHSQVREDAFDLYGFLDFEELGFFKELIGVNGIGPKVAIDIIALPIEKVKAAILNDDSEFLTKIPGIGLKTAKRLILELKNKIDINLMDRPYNTLEPKINEEAEEALLKLGYQRHQIRKIIKDLPENLEKTEEIVTYFLKNA